MPEQPLPEQLLITGGEVLDATGRRKADVLISNGSIVAVGTDAAAGVAAEQTSTGQTTATQTLAATGCVIVPGLVDLFACLGEPGNEQAETIATGSAAAALGGYTAIQAQPNTTPSLDSETNLTSQRHRASQASCEIVSAATITIGRSGTHLAAFGEFARAGVRWFTDVDHQPNPLLLLRAMQYAHSLGATIAVAPITPALSKGTVMAEGQVSARLGLRAEPAVSEQSAVDLLINLAATTGCHVHLDRVSTVGAVERLRYAKANETPNVSASVTAQHLYFTDQDCATFDPCLRAQPPYRTSADREALRAGVADGTIDAIVSGHMPHASEDVAVPFELAPPGALALQTAAAVAIGSSDLELAQAIAALSWQPAALASIADRHGCAIKPGMPANLAVIDPTSQWQLTKSHLVSGAHNSPYLGHTLTGQVRHTILAGRLIVCDGALSDAALSGADLSSAALHPPNQPGSNQPGSKQAGSKQA